MLNVGTEPEDCSHADRSRNNLPAWSVRLRPICCERRSARTKIPWFRTFPRRWATMIEAREWCWSTCGCRSASKRGCNRRRCGLSLTGRRSGNASHLQSEHQLEGS